MPVTDVHDEAQSSLLFDGDIRHSDWFYMKKLLADFQRELNAHDRHLLKAIVQWLIAYDMLQTYEDVVIISGEPSQMEKDHFRAALALVRGNGISLLSIIENLPYEIPKDAGVSVKDIAAMLDELAATEQAMSDKIPPASKQLLKQIFGAPPVTS